MIFRVTQKYELLFFFNANQISLRLKSKLQRIHTATFYLCDILTPLVGVSFKDIDQIQEPFLQKSV